MSWKDGRIRLHCKEISDDEYPDAILVIQILSCQLVYYDRKVVEFWPTLKSYWHIIIFF